MKTKNNLSGNIFEFSIYEYESEYDGADYLMVYTVSGRNAEVLRKKFKDSSDGDRILQFCQSNGIACNVQMIRIRGCKMKKLSIEHEKWLKENMGITIQELTQKKGKKREKLLDNLLVEEACMMDIDEKTCELIGEIIDYMTI